MIRFEQRIFAHQQTERKARMPDSNRPLDVYQNIQQFRLDDQAINYDHLLRAVINSLRLDGTMTLKQFIVRRVFSNGGPITNCEIVDLGVKIFNLDPDKLGCEFGYTSKECATWATALGKLEQARSELAPPEKLNDLVNEACGALGFMFAMHNR